MNLPNKLTVLRMIMVPIFVVFMLIPSLGGPANKYIALALFCVASFTDYLDGHLARKHNLVTNFGLICLCSKTMDERLDAWIVLVIIAREFIISGFRLVASDNGIVIAASYWGKFKTVSHMTMIIMLILNINHPIYHIATQVVVWVGLALTVISLVDYVWKNKEVLTKGGM